MQGGVFGPGFVDLFVDTTVGVVANFVSWSVLLFSGHLLSSHLLSSH